MCTKEQTCNVSARFSQLWKGLRSSLALGVYLQRHLIRKRVLALFSSPSLMLNNLYDLATALRVAAPVEISKACSEGVEHVTSEALSNASFVSVSIRSTRATRSHDVAAELPCLWTQKDCIITRATILHFVLSTATYSRGGS